MFDGVRQPVEDGRPRCKQRLAALHARGDQRGTDAQRSRGIEIVDRVADHAGAAEVGERFDRYAGGE